MQTSIKTYVVRPVDGLPAITWKAEKWFNGRRWFVDLDRNGHAFAHGIDPDEVPEAIKLTGGRKLLSP